MQLGSVGRGKPRCCSGNAPTLAHWSSPNRIKRVRFALAWSGATERGALGEVAVNGAPARRTKVGANARPASSPTSLIHPNGMGSNGMEEGAIAKRLLGTSHARVYRHLPQRLGAPHMEAEIVAATGVSRSAVNLAVRDLAKAGRVVCESRGRSKFYSFDPADPVVRRFKVWETTPRLMPMLKRLRPVARRVTLFGSAAQGTDSAESDIDLFIVGTDRRAIRAAVRPSVQGRRVQAVVVSEQELASLKADDPAFHRQVQQGLVLLEQPGGDAES